MHHDHPVAYLTSGGAGMFCGSCMRDNTLVAELHKLGCPALLIPTYTPIRTDEENVSEQQVFLGGINMYLQQKSPLFRWLPAFVDRWLDNPRLIERLSSRQIKVNARDLGEMSVSVMRGEHGHQRKEVHRLVRWLAQDVKPRLVNLSNVMIAGCVPAIKRELNVPVLATLQGDDLFLEELEEPYRSQALAEVRRLAQQVDGFLVFTNYYADFMAKYLEVPREKMHLVPMGLKLDDAALATEAAAPRAPTVGYFARICPAKGFHVLVDAFLRLRALPGMEHARLHAAGWLGEGDRAYYEQQLAKLATAGATGQFHYAGVVDRQEKFHFLRGLDVFSVPTTYREPKGIYVLEALAAGVPVVQPEHGSFPELLETTGGGQLVPPEDPARLADTLHLLLRNSELRGALASAGRAGVRRHFGAEHMARETLAVYQRFLSPIAAPAALAAPR
ncbi:MAG: glycosyltransferase family 4 protein [Pirellulales bacterium]